MFDRDIAGVGFAAFRTLTRDDQQAVAAAELDRARRAACDCSATRLVRRADCRRSGQVPLHVRIRFTPFATGLQDDYTPALRVHRWIGGAVSAQFDSVSHGVGSAAVKALPSDLNNQVGAGRPKITYAVAAIRAGAVLAATATRRGCRRRTDKDTYVFFGPRRSPSKLPTWSAFIDPQLPEWIRGSLAPNRAGDAGALYAGAGTPAPA